MRGTVDLLVSNTKKMFAVQGILYLTAFFSYNSPLKSYNFKVIDTFHGTSVCIEELILKQLKVVKETGQKLLTMSGTIMIAFLCVLFSLSHPLSVLFHFAILHLLSTVIPEVKL